MPFDQNIQIAKCPICDSPSNLRDDFGNISSKPNDMGFTLVDCPRCGDFAVSRELCDDWQEFVGNDKIKIPLASHVIRSRQGSKERRHFDLDRLAQLIQGRNLATVAEAAEAFIHYVGNNLRNDPGKTYVSSWMAFASILGVGDTHDVYFIVTSLESRGLVKQRPSVPENAIDSHRFPLRASLTFDGWRYYEELNRSHVQSRYAFFARKFDNKELDAVVRNCLDDAVKETGYELRTVSQKAGLVDAIIEDEIRRCRFLIADLSDDNPGAYWEAGFAEGLGKPVIYICTETKDGAEKKTHFDTDHRHTVRWDSAKLEQTAAQLKAVIRNTLLGDAR